MLVYEIVEDARGMIETVKLSNGIEFKNLKALNEWCLERKEILYGENLNSLIVNAKSSKDIKASNRGRGLQVYGVKFVDMTAWNLSLKADAYSQKIVEDLHKFYDVEKIPASPSTFVARQISMAAKDSDCVKLSQNCMNFNELFLSSTKLGDRGFSPAYRGGLLASPADPSKVYENIESFDVNSMYPWAAITALVPLGKSFEAPEDFDYSSLKFREDGFIEGYDGYGYIGLFIAKGVKKKDYVALNLFRNDGFYVVDGEFDRNGLVECSELRFACCPYDLEVFKMQYDYDALECVSINLHSVGKIPSYAKNLINEMFIKKSEACGVEKINAKIAVNTIIGYFGVDPLRNHDAVKLLNISKLSECGELMKSFDSYTGRERGLGIASGMKRAWDYRWAVYITAFSRLRLARMEKLMTSLGLEVLYGDTDSIKVCGDSSIAHNAISLDQPIIGELGRWKDESDDYALGAVFKNIKLYAHNGKSGKKMKAAGCPKDAAKELVENYTLEEIARARTIEVTATKREIFELDKVSSFGSIKVYAKIIQNIEYKE